MLPGLWASFYSVGFVAHYPLELSAMSELRRQTESAI
jgi:hypothetical protein